MPPGYGVGTDAKGAIGKVPPTVGLVEPQLVHLPPDRLRFVRFPEGRWERSSSLRP